MKKIVSLFNYNSIYRKSLFLNKNLSKFNCSNYYDQETESKNVKENYSLNNKINCLMLHPLEKKQ